MKLYALDGTPSKEKELLTEFQEAREIGALKIGEANLFFRVRLRQYYIPFTDIKRCFRRVYMVPATMCCGKGNLDIENLVIQGEAGELAQIQLPGPADEFFEMIGDSTIPLSMVMIGYQLAQRNLRGILANRKLVAASLLHMLVVPALTFLAVNWLPIADAAKVILIFAACFPTAVMPATIAAEEGKNAGLLSEGIALTTAMSIVTLPLAAFFLMHWYGIG